MRLFTLGEGEKKKPNLERSLCYTSSRFMEPLLYFSPEHCFWEASLDGPCSGTGLCESGLPSIYWSLVLRGGRRPGHRSVDYILWCCETGTQWDAGRTPSVTFNSVWQCYVEGVLYTETSSQAGLSGTEISSFRHGSPTFATSLCLDAHYLF